MPLEEKARLKCLCSVRPLPWGATEAASDSTVFGAAVVATEASPDRRTVRGVRAARAEVDRKAGRSRR